MTFFKFSFKLEFIGEWLNNKAKQNVQIIKSLSGFNSKSEMEHFIVVAARYISDLFNKFTR